MSDDGALFHLHGTCCRVCKFALDTGHSWDRHNCGRLAGIAVNHNVDVIVIPEIVLEDLDVVVSEH